MNPARVFAKQVPKTQALEVVPGGEPEFDSTSIALACKDIPRKYYLAARLCWAIDWTVAVELERLLWVTAAGMAHERKWSFIKRGEERVRKLCGLAIAELADPARYNNNTKRGAWMGVSDRHFRRTYAEAYRDIYDRLMAWCDVAAHHIRRNTRSG